MPYMKSTRLYKIINMEEKQRDVITQQVVITNLAPLTVQGRIFFKDDNQFNDDIIETFEDTIKEISEDMPMFVSVIPFYLRPAVAVIENTPYTVLVEIDFNVDKLNKENKVDENLFKTLSSLIDSCLNIAIRTKHTDSLYEATKKDLKMYESNTSTEEKECN